MSAITILEKAAEQYGFAATQYAKKCMMDVDPERIGSNCHFARKFARTAANMAIAADKLKETSGEVKLA